MSNLVSTFNQKNAPYFLDENWTWYYWKDIISSYQQGLIRSNSELNEIDGIDYFKMNFINENGTYTFNGLPKTFATSEEIDNYKIKNGDFFINVRNSKELVGKCCVVYDVNKNILFNHMLVRINHKEYVTGSFINAYFNTKFGKKLIETCKKGTTTVIALYQKDLYNIPIPIPKKNILERIDELYNSINKKIELNSRINAELEAMAKTLYDYWFVQFDFPNSPLLEGGQNSENFDGVFKPYKSSGGKMVYNETLKREIPEGWEVKTVGDFAKIKKGTLITERTANINGNVKVVSAGLDFSYYHSESNFSNNTITISASGANAGYINFWREPIFACDCTTVRGNNDFETFYILQFLKSVQEFIFSQARGSAQPHVYPKDIESLKIIIPNEEILHKYGEIVYSMNEKITNNLKQNQELSALRDWLLPMLMNGQVKVG